MNRFYLSTAKNVTIFTVQLDEINENDKESRLK